MEPFLPIRVFPGAAYKILIDCGSVVSGVAGALTFTAERSAGNFVAMPLSPFFLRKRGVKAADQAAWAIGF